LGSEFAVKFRINTFTAVVNIEALAAFLTKPLLIFLTGGNGITFRMIAALHLSSPLISKDTKLVP
jgi:hypothetical protein